MVERSASRSPKGAISAPDDRRVASAPSPKFVAAAENLDGGTPVVSVMGEVDLATAPVLEQTLCGVAANRPGKVIVDLTGCSFFDARGLRALVATKMRLARSNESLAVVVSNPNVLRIFRLTGCEALFEIHPTLGAAVNGNG